MPHRYNIVNINNVYHSISHSYTTSAIDISQIRQNRAKIDHRATFYII